jgi:N-acetyl-gamma-glutamyl-phosphate reductase
MTQSAPRKSRQIANSKSIFQGGSMIKVFVDGQAGTTGLKILERLEKRSDVEQIAIDLNLRKDARARAQCINEADVVFLCLPDDAAREAVPLCTNPHTIIIDASTAHRTQGGWDYGIPELSPIHRKAIAHSKRIANPGCYASGFIVPVRPLVAAGLLAPDCPVTVNAISGYSGGGKKMITQYESRPLDSKLFSPRSYGLNMAHKHLPEMQLYSGLDHAPLFIPTVANFYQGMTVSIPLPKVLLKKSASAQDIRDQWRTYYRDQPFIRIMDGAQDDLDGAFLDAQGCNGTNRMDLFIFESKENLLLVARLDNLGKGASGAAIQCMNIAMGLDETIGLVLYADKA